MKYLCLIRKAAFVIALIFCICISMPVAMAAGETETKETSAAVLTEEEKVAEFKTEVIRLVNIEREKAGVDPLEEMDMLNAMADLRAEESAASFKHTRPDGTRCFTVFAENEMKYRAAGENLAYGFSTPARVVRAWMNSESHCRNILDPDFEFIGIGYYINENGRIYCSQLFYTPK